MPTIGDGLYIPGGSEKMSEVLTQYSAMQSSVQTVVNAAILQNGIPKFVNAAARTIAFATTPPIVGSQSYLQDIDSYEKWDGTTWAPVISQATAWSNIPVVSGTATVPGSVVAAIRKDGNQVQFRGSFWWPTATAVPQGFTVASLTSTQISAYFLTHVRLLNVNVWNASSGSFVAGTIELTTAGKLNLITGLGGLNSGQWAVGFEGTTYST